MYVRHLNNNMRMNVSKKKACELRTCFGVLSNVYVQKQHSLPSDSDLALVASLGCHSMSFLFRTSSVGFSNVSGSNCSPSAVETGIWRLFGAGNRGNGIWFDDIAARVIMKLEYVIISMRVRQNLQFDSRNFCQAPGSCKEMCTMAAHVLAACVLATCAMAACALHTCWLHWLHTCCYYSITWYASNSLLESLLEVVNGMKSYKKECKR